MDDYQVPGYEDEPPPSERREQGSRLPGGISVQTAAAILLVFVLIALLYLFFGKAESSPDQEYNAFVSSI